MRVTATFTFAFAISALAGSAMAADPVACEGVFASDSSEARLVEAFGRDNVVTGDVDGPEGTTMLATTVYPDDPARALQFTWWDEETNALIANVRLPPEADGPGGVRTGMSVGEVEALNGEPFELTGFFWDYGGYAGFQSGRLAEIAGGCMLSLSFTPMKDDLTEAQSEAVSGDMMLNSDLPVLGEIDTRLVTINFGYPAPEGMFEDWDEPAEDDAADE